MSAIHVKTIIEALDKYPKTIDQLSDETQYSYPKVMQYLLEARIDGHLLDVERVPDSPSVWTHKEGCCEQ